MSTQTFHDIFVYQPALLGAPALHSAVLSENQPIRVVKAALHQSALKQRSRDKDHTYSGADFGPGRTDLPHHVCDEIWTWARRAVVGPAKLLVSKLERQRAPGRPLNIIHAHAVDAASPHMFSSLVGGAYFSHCFSCRCRSPQRRRIDRHWPRFTRRPTTFWSSRQIYWYCFCPTCRRASWARVFRVQDDGSSWWLLLRRIR